MRTYNFTSRELAKFGLPPTNKLTRETASYSSAMRCMISMWPHCMLDTRATHSREIIDSESVVSKP